MKSSVRLSKRNSIRAINLGDRGACLRSGHRMRECMTVLRKAFALQNGFLIRTVNVAIGVVPQQRNLEGTAVAT